MAKRANGEGSLYKRDDGRWVGAFTYEDPITGTVKRTVVYGKTQAEARAKMRERRARADAGQPVRDSRVTLGDYADRWMGSTLAASARKESTKATYSTLARVHIIGRSIGDTTLDRLKPSDVERFVLDLRDAGKAQATVRQVYTVLRAILDAAVRDGLIARNPAAQVARPGVDRHDARYLTRDEVDRLLAAAEGTRYAPVLELLAFTGMRRGEALALRWDDIDFDARLIRVRGTLGRVGGILLVTDTKTERSRRAIPLSERAARVLRAVGERQAAERVAARDEWRETGFVFTTELGHPVDPRNALRALTRAADRAGLEGVGLHTLRHSAASAMLGTGVPLKAVSDVLGHSSVAITGDVYGHMAPEVQRSALDALAAAYGAE
ncbi:site-specific integrase [Isoptericola sp. b490]|uniref:tyrosine-type recombinase/integrase n=1 Tax=Actinotalea lenta TaxID=3064654 RepID=UPI00271358D8|nr:site-specific integrase [Isoptericola sp. b490]MDO8120638.1 site-specific integrase [Isoptericola sp. b490]